MRAPALLRGIAVEEVRRSPPAPPGACGSPPHRGDPGQAFWVPDESSLCSPTTWAKAGHKSPAAAPCHGNSSSNNVFLDPSREAQIWIRCAFSERAALFFLIYFWQLLWFNRHVVGNSPSLEANLSLTELHWLERLHQGWIWPIIFSIWVNII